MAYDPRAIANLILKFARTHRASVTNFSVNKIIYFLHGHYLAMTGSPLVDEPFEAWKHGPVISSVYYCFKKFGDQPITELARRMDFRSAQVVDVLDELDERDLNLLAIYINIYTRASVSQLYDWSHIEGGPWHQTWNHKTLSSPGMVISNESIANHFQREADLHGGFRV